MSNNLDYQYQELLKTIINEGIQKSDRTGTGTKSIFGYQIRHKMSDGFPLLTTKKLHFKSIVTELIWFLKGDTNIKFLVDNNCNIWNGDAYKNYSSTIMDGGGIPYNMEDFVNQIKTDDRFAQRWGNLGPIYGAQWRMWTDFSNIDVTYFDQIKTLVDDLRNNPDSRRLMVNAWNVAEVKHMVLPPCHYGFQLYTRLLTAVERENWYAKSNSYTEQERCEMNPNCTDEDVHQIMNEEGVPTRAISLMWNQRSVDTFLGLPYNIASYGLLLEILAQEVEMVPDELIGNLGDTHLYLNHLDQANEQLGRSWFDLPTIKITQPTYSEDIPVLTGFAVNNFELVGYEAHASIKAQLSN